MYSVITSFLGQNRTTVLRFKGNTVDLKQKRTSYEIMEKITFLDLVFLSTKLHVFPYFVFILRKNWKIRMSQLRSQDMLWNGKKVTVFLLVFFPVTLP